MSFDDFPSPRAFGTWDAPVTDGAVWIDVPTELVCIHCGEPFVDGDNGAIMPTGFAEHRECGYRAVMGGIGHHVDHVRYCHGELGTDAGLPRRVSAWLVWRREVERRVVTEDHLELLRDGEARICLRCGWITHHPHDREHGYCANCDDFTRGFPGPAAP